MTVYYYSKNPNGYITGKQFSIDAPAATVMANGIAGDHHRSILLADDGRQERPRMTDPGKPPYRVPLMREIAAIPWNGLTVVSTFAGAGGSSTGYRMAGYRVLLANEFVPIAQESYAANMGSHTVLAREDIKQLTGAEIMRRTGLKRGQLNVLDGSPPCQAFSTAGKREKGWGTDRHYEHGARQRNEDLFKEYIRMVHHLEPEVFVAENVSGLVKGVAKGYFINILAALKAAGPGYEVEARLLDAQWLGVPQARERIIFVGVRRDLAGMGFRPAFPKPLQYRYSVRDALPWLSSVVHDTSGLHSTGEVIDRPAPAITVGGEVSNAYHFKVEHQTHGQHKSHGDVPERPAPPIVARRPASFAVQAEQLVGVGGRGGFGNVVISSPSEPAATIGTDPHSGNGLNPPGTIYVRPPGGGDVTRRKFTIAEVMQICSFPPDFVLRGSYAQQWERLGNSVPPVMMMHVAAAIRDAVLLPAKARTSGPGRRSGDRSTTGKHPKGAGTRPPRAAPSAAKRTAAPALSRRKRSRPGKRTGASATDAPR